MADKPRLVCVYSLDADRIMVHSNDGAETGDPCLMIAADRESIADWGRQLVRISEGDTDMEELPGYFAKVDNENI